ncbi:tyrosine-type recombinase/integrase [Candidatus Caldatribacterium sp. SIUC1]|uniref:tyrosine-type recombinase/integrase n=1 Tax=Candidatus Caldatribacterium sp. SIUC1 TaxID=3418365 RepID=UPI003F68FAE2
MLKAANKKTWEGFRNYVMLLTFLDTGLRLSELLGLTADRVNLIKGSLLVTGKGSKDREAYMGRTLKKEMARWLKMQGFHAYEEHVFITRDGRVSSQPTRFGLHSSSGPFSLFFFIGTDRHRAPVRA